MHPQRGSSFFRTIRNQPYAFSILSSYNSFPPLIPVPDVRISHHKLYHHHQQHSPLLEHRNTTNRSSDSQRLSEFRALFSTITTYEFPCIIDTFATQKVISRSLLIERAWD